MHTQGNFYITTPIYYANDKPHIGHAYTTILADVLSRYHRLMGDNVFFLTGTDEHGQKVQQAATARGVSPKAQVDEFHVRFKELWTKLEIEYDHFIRTTDEYHVKFVQEALQQLYEKGEIYEQEYEGWYSVGEERFYSDDELVDGKDPVSGRPVEWLKERNYFFKMSKYQDRLIQHINENPDFILPRFRANEVLGFLKQPLQDLCISRPKSRLSWGIPLPFDENFVTYVWFDALLNYQSGVKDFTFPDGRKAWPANIHLIGKDILTTHCVYWPAMLMGMERTLPRSILAHGWWLTPKKKDDTANADAVEGEKMSKSKGNVADPMALTDAHGVDSVRYFLMRDMVLGQDSIYEYERFVNRINTDLANDLGNGLNRVSKFVLANFDGTMPIPGKGEGPEEDLCKTAEEVIKNCQEMIEATKLSFALEEVSRLVREVNKYLEVRAPWKMIKEIGDGDKTPLATVLITAAEALRIALVLLYPVMPKKTRQGLAMLGIQEKPSRDSLKWGLLKGGEKLDSLPSLFPRIETEAAKAQKEKKGKEAVQEMDPAAKLDFRVARIKVVENHPDADGLFKLTVDDGQIERTVCAGLKAFYKPEELQDRKVVLLANLKPAKLRGVESHGMLLAADLPDGKASLLDPGEIETGITLQFGDIAAQPKAKASIKDFDKLGLKVGDGKVIYGKKILGKNDVSVQANAPDGAEVH